MATLHVYGGAAEVTGSCYLLRVAGRQLLIECGLIQGLPADEARNHQPFPFEPKALDAVILTHAHLDHSGRLPLLVKRGFLGPIYAHPATGDLCNILLQDSANIYEREVDRQNRQHLRHHTPLMRPLYDLDDTFRTLRQFRSLPYGKHIEILPGVTLRLLDAGHILGSSIVELWISENGLARKLVFSGDLGHPGAPVMPPPAAVDQADLVVLESTYGDRLHPGSEASWDELGRILASAAREGGNVLIPAFAVGRTQDLLYSFARHFERWELARWRVFLDSPLAIEATEIYRRHIALLAPAAQRFYAGARPPFSLPNLQICRSAEQSMALNRLHQGAIIIAGSGMCEGGRIRHHFKHHLWREGCHVVIVGFQVEGTLGRALVDGASTIELWGERLEVAATVHALGGLSAHADHDGLLEWYRGIPGQPAVMLIHGEENARQQLAVGLRQRLGVAALCPQYGDCLDLETLKFAPSTSARTP